MLESSRSNWLDARRNVPLALRLLELTRIGDKDEAGDGEADG